MPTPDPVEITPPPLDGVTAVVGKHGSSPMQRRALQIANCLTITAEERLRSNRQTVGLSHLPSCAGLPGKKAARPGLRGSRALRGLGADRAGAGGPQRPAVRASQVSGAGRGETCSRDLQVSSRTTEPRRCAPRIHENAILRADPYRRSAIGRHTRSRKWRRAGRSPPCLCSPPFPTAQASLRPSGRRRIVRRAVASPRVPPRRR